MLWCMQTVDLRKAMVRAHCSCVAHALSGRREKKWQAYLDSTIDIPTEPEYYQALDWMALRRARALLLRRIVTISPFPSSSACLKQPPPLLLQAAAQQETGSIIVVPHPAPTSQAAPKRRLLVSCVKPCPLSHSFGSTG